MTERWQVNSPSSSGRSTASVHRIVTAFLDFGLIVVLGFNGCNAYAYEKIKPKLPRSKAVLTSERARMAFNNS